MMNRKHRTAICWLTPLLLAMALILVWSVRTPMVNASLYELIGKASERIPKFVREASSSEIAIIVSSQDAAAAGAAAETMREQLSIKVKKTPSGNSLEESALEFLREHRAGLVTPEMSALLTTQEGRAKIARRAQRRLYGSPLPPLLGYADDPFGLTDGFAATLLPQSMKKTSGGCPLLVTNGVTHVLLRHRLDPDVAGNIDATIAAVEKLREIGAVTSRRFQAIDLHFAGAPVHSATAASRSKREIGALTWFSLAVIAALALLVFRSWRWLPLLASSLAVSALAGGLVLIVCFRELYVMTLVMGTTVLGLVIDYSFHWLLSAPADKPEVRRNLLVSFLTTEISLVPLMLSSIPVLCQSALFLGVGLTAALGYVWFAYPCEIQGQRSEVRGQTAERVHHCLTFDLRPLTCCAALIVVIALWGIFRCSVKTEVTALYRPPAALMAAERLRAAFGSFNLAAFPTLAVRERNAANVVKLYAEQGSAMAETLGLKELLPPPPPCDLILQPQALMDSIFADWTAESLRRLGLAVVALLIVLVLCCRMRALRLLAPPVMAILVVAGGLGWTGTPINLFHILAMFLLLGMGIDYSVFLQSGNRAVMRPALSSLLTSMAGFGALAFVSFPVVGSFGMVLGVGLPLAFGLALLVDAEFCSRTRQSASLPMLTRRTSASTWTRQSASLPSGSGQKYISTSEHCANTFGLELLFLIYRLFGLAVLHLLAAAVGTSVWIFSPSVRRASPSLKKLVNFTRSLADKLVVMGEGHSLPHVEPEASVDAAAFLSDVRMGKGVFVLSSHVGTIEVLTALGDCECTFHAWMDFERTGVFNRFYLRHARRRRVEIHPISAFGMQTVFEAGDWIDHGNCLVMAGDRGDGAFRFAAAFDHPVYFVACVAEAGCRYRVVIRRLPAERKAMKAEYERQLKTLIAQYPLQHFVWDGACS